MGPPHPPFDPAALLAQEAERRSWIDPADLMADLLPEKDACLVDVGAGAGFFALPAARRLVRGTVLAVDRQRDMVGLIAQRARQQGLGNLRAVVADASALPAEDGGADAVLMSVVLHDLEFPAVALAEARRVLRPFGRLHVIEFMPGAGPHGPPDSVRLAPDRLAAMLEAATFTVVDRRDGPGPLYRLSARPGP
jgi:ubiquinone/menaquinone biosynthesis C-methylase UbiE